MQPTGRLSIAQAALRLGLTYHQVRNRLFCDVLKGGCDEFGRFYIDAADADRYFAERKTSATAKRQAKRRIKHSAGEPDAAA